MATRGCTAEMLVLFICLMVITLDIGLMSLLSVSDADTLYMPPQCEQFFPDPLEMPYCR